VNSNALDAAVTGNRDVKLNLVKIPGWSADRGITRDIRRSRQPHLRPVLRLKVAYRTKVITLRRNRALAPFRPFKPARVLVGAILHVESDVAI
jgi:hypothetical protein